LFSKLFFHTWCLCLIAFGYANFWWHSSCSKGHTRCDSFMGMLNISCTNCFTQTSPKSKPIFYFYGPLFHLHNSWI
jgi:hypothetical protein